MAKTKKKEKRTVHEGKVYIQATFNNVLITITDMQGDAIANASAGALGFKGGKKSTPFAAQLVAETAGNKAKEVGLSDIHVYVKGPGIGREAAIRSLGNVGFHVQSIRDITPIPHNGCRPRKSRRV